MAHFLTRRLVTAALAVGLALPFASAARSQGAEQPLRGKTFTIGIHNGTPWAYRNKEGQFVGYHVDILRAALVPLGAKFEFVIADFASLIPGLLANRFDMIASGVAITPARCQQILFSEPDLAIGDGLLVEKGNPKKLHSYADIAKDPTIKLGAGRATSNAKNALEAGVPEAQMVYFPSTEAVVSAIVAGRVAAGTLSAGAAAGFVADPDVKGVERALPFKGLTKPDGQPALMYTGTVFRKDDAQLRDAYNAQLAKLKQDGTLAKLMQRYGFSEAETAREITTADVCAGKN